MITYDFINKMIKMRYINPENSSNSTEVADVSDSCNDETIRRLEQDIVFLEKELQEIEQRIHTMELQIQCRFRTELSRIRELASIYKKQKLAKKEKRREQKKRGKNYREPTGLKISTDTMPAAAVSDVTDRQEMKKLYREAVLLVHPDKFVNESEEKCKRSEELTVQLIDIYQSGNIEELRHIYHHIVSGNAMDYGTDQTKSFIPDPKAMHAYLKKKKDNLSAALSEAMQSRIYEVLTTYDQPLKFIDELALQITIRISQLERRTRS